MGSALRWREGFLSNNREFLSLKTLKNTTGIKKNLKIKNATNIFNRLEGLAGNAVGRLHEKCWGEFLRK